MFKVARKMNLNALIKNVSTCQAYAIKQRIVKMDLMKSYVVGHCIFEHFLVMSLILGLSKVLQFGKYYQLTF